MVKFHRQNMSNNMLNNMSNKRRTSVDEAPQGTQARGLTHNPHPFDETSPVGTTPALSTTVTRKKQMVRVGLSGVLATALDVSALVVLIEVFGVYVTIAAFVAAISGGVANFLVNKFWAFGDRTSIGVRQIATYAFVSLTTGLFVAGAVHIFAVGLGWPYLIAKAIAAALVFVAWSYPAQAKLVFRDARAKSRLAA